MRPLQYLGKESHQEPRENYPTYPTILQHRLHDQSFKEQNEIRNVSESTEHGDATARKDHSDLILNQDTKEEDRN